MAKPKYKYVMDYIDDKDTFRAVMFACEMIKQGRNYHQAVRIASRYYDVDMDDVRHYVSQRSGRIQAERRTKPNG